jgi:vang-like
MKDPDQHKMNAVMIFEKILFVLIHFQDENWGETTTAVTTASDLEYAMEDLSKWQIQSEQGLAFRCQQYIGPVTSGLLATAAFISPILMVILPKVGAFNMREDHLTCDVTCDGMLISFSFKLLILLLGTWGLFFRRPRTTLPRIFVFRALISLLILVFILTFWLFYGVHLLEERSKIEYKDIVQYALSLIDALLFVHYLAIILIELRHNSAQFYVKVVRSPDGQSASYTLGEFSIQRAAASILEKYYVDFPIYNPYLDTVPAASRNKKAFKLYDVDGMPNGAINVSKG